MSIEKVRVLVVDDNPKNVQVLGLTLMQAGYNVTVANDGKQALMTLETEVPDIILSDIRMPVMDGYEFCKKVKENEMLKDIPFLFLTASDNPKDEVLGLQIGAIDFITKPINPPVILQRVQTHLQLRQALLDLEDKYKILEENQKLRDDVESISRHDMKGPLQGILGVPQLLRLDTNLTSQQLSYLDLMEESALILLDMINRSLDIYKMEMGTYEVHRKEIDVVKTIRKVVNLCQPLQRNNKNLKIKITLNGNELSHLSNNTLFIMTDEMLFFSLFSNLLKNAVEASPENEVVHIHLTEAKVGISLVIQNRGAVPKKIRTTFFNKFVTADKAHGTGLGTYSIKLISETLGGTVSLNTEIENQTTITVNHP